MRGVPLSVASEIGEARMAGTDGVITTFIETLDGERIFGIVDGAYTNKFEADWPGFGIFEAMIEAAVNNHDTLTFYLTPYNDDRAERLDNVYGIRKVIGYGYDFNSPLVEDFGRWKPNKWEGIRRIK